MASCTALVLTVASPTLTGAAPDAADGRAPAWLVYGSADRCSASDSTADVCRSSSMVRASRGRGAVAEGLPLEGCVRDWKREPDSRILSKRQARSPNDPLPRKLGRAWGWAATATLRPPLVSHTGRTSPL
ncbi:hypothetical protein VTG60DRAFT_2969 [Thermothelomyces hinnuleus]